MRWYVFRVYRNGWTKKRFYAGNIIDAAMMADEWCEANGYSDWTLEGGELA